MTGFSTDFCPTFDLNRNLSSDTTCCTSAGSSRVRGLHTPPMISPLSNPAFHSLYNNEGVSALQSLGNSSCSMYGNQLLSSRNSLTASSYLLGPPHAQSATTPSCMALSSGAATPLNVLPPPSVSADYINSSPVRSYGLLSMSNASANSQVTAMRSPYGNNGSSSAYGFSQTLQPQQLAQHNQQYRVVDMFSRGSTSLAANNPVSDLSCNSNFSSYGPNSNIHTSTRSLGNSLASGRMVSTMQPGFYNNTTEDSQMLGSAPVCSSATVGSANGINSMSHLDLLEFPSLSSRCESIVSCPIQPVSQLRTPYVGMVKQQQVSDCTEFTMTSEDFPALPGNPSSADTRSVTSTSSTPALSNAISSSSDSLYHMENSKALPAGTIPLGCSDSLGLSGNSSTLLSTSARNMPTQHHPGQQMTSSMSGAANSSLCSYQQQYAVLSANTTNSSHISSNAGLCLPAHDVFNTATGSSAIISAAKADISASNALAMAGANSVLGDQQHVRSIDARMLCTGATLQQQQHGGVANSAGYDSSSRAKISHTHTTSSIGAGNRNPSMCMLSDGRVTRVPSGMLTDQFGMVGFFSFIRTADTDASMVQLAQGYDLISLGLDLKSSENQYLTYGGAWAQTACRAQDIDFYVPREYLTNSMTREKLAPISLPKYSEDLLFYLFYMYTGDVLQLLAARELFNRDWRFHKEECVWITRSPGVVPLEKAQTFERGTYYYFDTTLWRKVTKEFCLDYDKLEEKSERPTYGNVFTPL